jgi:hypothetical protein
VIATSSAEPFGPIPSSARCGSSRSSYGGAEDQRQALEAGFDAWMSKPIDLVVLEQQLAGWARARTQDPAGRGGPMP